MTNRPATARRLAAFCALGTAIAIGAAAVAALVPDDTVARAGGEQQASTGTESVRDLLGGIDYVPDRNTLDEVFDDESDSALIELARDRSGGGDPGVRIRALRALAMYGGKAVESALTDAVEDHSLARDGVDIAYLRAAMTSLATVADDNAVRILSPVLDHVMRDARAATAHALAKTGDKAALQPLYRRLESETEPMVRVAIEAAIRALSEGP